MGYSIGCTSCNYNYSLISHYIYSNNEGSINICPDIRFGWCLDCNDFRDIQIGIKINDVLKKVISYKNELARLESRFIKLPHTKRRIEFLRKEILEGEFLMSILDNKDSYSSCIKCGSTNIIFKDIKNSIWKHHKCLGHFIISENCDDVRFRIEPVRILPVTKKPNLNIIELIARCSLDMLNNHQATMSHFNLLKYIPRKEDSTYIIFIRQAFIIAYLCYERKLGLDNNIIRDLYDFMGFDNLSFESYRSYILRSYVFFDKEIYYSKVGKYFVPSKICYPFIYPLTENLSHDLTKQVIDLKDSFLIWKVITDTYSTYFSNK